MPRRPYRPTADGSAWPTGESESRLAYVYGLADPETDAVRYVGRTSNIRSVFRRDWTLSPSGCLSDRLDHHMTAARRGDSRPVCVWLRSLLARGLRPHVVALRCVARGAEGVVEREEIDARASASPPLLNVL